jgi:hypothetical protein
LTGSLLQPTRVFRRCSALWADFVCKKVVGGCWRIVIRSHWREDLQDPGDDGTAQSGSAVSCSIAVLRWPWRVSPELSDSKRSLPVDATTQFRSADAIARQIEFTEIRIGMGVSQSDFSKLLGFSDGPSHVSKFERGEQHALYIGTCPRRRAAAREAGRSRGTRTSTRRFDQRLGSSDQRASKSRGQQ